MCKALGATGRTWAYTLREWTEEEGDLTKVLTDALWWRPQGGQTMVGEGGS